MNSISTHNPKAPTLAQISFGQTWELQVPCTWMTYVRRNKRTPHTLHLVTPGLTMDLPHLHKFYPDGPKNPNLPHLDGAPTPVRTNRGYFCAPPRSLSMSQDLKWPMHEFLPDKEWQASNCALHSNRAGDCECLAHTCSPFEWGKSPMLA